MKIADIVAFILFSVIVTGATVFGNVVIRLLVALVIIGVGWDDMKRRRQW